MRTHDNSAERRLEALFKSYRETCGAPEPGANFMPQVWEKIEARQSVFVFGRLTRAFVTAAMALSLAMAAYLALPGSAGSGFYSGSYVEALAVGDASEQLDYAEPAAPDDI
ncbi:MAG: hypothetical protein FJW37_03045 [Acidobacteria bacterium]|nr:hypothetical protein [Acidobacteriota bacterium]